MLSAFYLKWFKKKKKIINPYREFSYFAGGNVNGSYFRKEYGSFIKS